MGHASFVTSERDEAVDSYTLWCHTLTGEKAVAHSIRNQPVKIAGRREKGEEGGGEGDATLFKYPGRIAQSLGCSHTNP